MERNEKTPRPPAHYKATIVERTDSDYRINEEGEAHEMVRKVAREGLIDMHRLTGKEYIIEVSCWSD